MTFLSNNLDSPQKIWDWILSVFQADMSKAMYDTWVKPAQPISFQDAVFTIGCYNQYAADWINSRLRTLIERQLTGVLGQPVKLSVVLLHDLPDEEVDETPGVEKDASGFLDLDDQTTEYQPVYVSLRDAIIQPDRVVKLPVYFLRWLPYVGARTIFEVMGLWQEYYLSSRGKQPNGGEKVATRIENIGQWAGVSRAQLFRDLAPHQPLTWFMNKIETNYETDRSTGRSKKSANKYALYGIPLTPGDAEDLAAFLNRVHIRDRPEQALREAIAAQPKQILQYPFRSPPEDFPKMTPRRITVHEVIREALGHRLNAEQADLADKLADRLLAPGDFLLARWYFLQHWLPLLGPNAAMMILLLRNLCYFNDETGDIREDVWIEGGNTALAARLGIDNPRQIALLFPAALTRGCHKERLTTATNQEMVRRQRIQEWVACFVRRTEYRPNNGDYDWRFHVQRMDPLVPEHEQVKQAAFQLLFSADDQGVLGELYRLLDLHPNGCFETVKNNGMIVLRLSKNGNDCSETLRMVLNDWIETVKMLPNDCFETLLKILKSFKDSQKEKETSPNQDSPRFPEILPAGVGEREHKKRVWELEGLLRRVNSRVRETIITQEKDALALVSWILYGVANLAIQNPLSLAVAKLTDQPELSAGGVFDRLAKLSVVDFAEEYREALTWQGSSNVDWRTAFKGIERERLMLLADLLDLSIDSGEDA